MEVVVLWKVLVVFVHFAFEVVCIHLEIVLVVVI